MKNYGPMQPLGMQTYVRRVIRMLIMDMGTAVSATRPGFIQWKNSNTTGTITVTENHIGKIKIQIGTVSTSTT